MNHITFRQDKENKVVLRKPLAILSDGNSSLSAEFSGKCEDNPEAFNVLATVCNGMIQFSIIHTCTPSVDQVFCLDVGTYTVTLKDGLTVVDTFKVRIIN